MNIYAHTIKCRHKTNYILPYIKYKLNNIGKPTYQ